MIYEKGKKGTTYQDLSRINRLLLGANLDPHDHCIAQPRHLKKIDVAVTMTTVDKDMTSAVELKEKKPSPVVWTMSFAFGNSSAIPTTVISASTLRVSSLTK